MAHLQDPRERLLEATDKSSKSLNILHRAGQRGALFRSSGEMDRPQPRLDIR
jgi:hypothetical protein